MSDDSRPPDEEDLARLAHAYHHDGLDDRQAEALARAVGAGGARGAAALEALAIDGQLAVALAADGGLQAVERLRQSRPSRSGEASRPAGHGSSRRLSARRLRLRRRRSRTAGWLAAAALVAAIGAALWSSQRQQPTLMLADVSPQGSGVSLLHRGTATIVGAPTGLADGDRIDVAVGETAAITCTDEASILHLSGPAQLTVEAAVPGKHLRLRRGRLDASMAPQPAGRPLVVATPYTVVTVVGTIFAIDADERRDRVEVEHGRVSVAPVGPGATLIVDAGQAAEAGAGIVLALLTPPVPTALAPAPAPTATPLISDRGLVARWSFDDALGANALDPAHPAQLTRLDHAVGRHGTALRFADEHAVMRFPVGDLSSVSFSAWMRRDDQSTAGTNPVILTLPGYLLFTYLGGETNHTFHLTTRDRKPLLGWSTNPHQVRIGEWQHIAVAIALAANGTPEPAIYVDGVRQQLWPWTGDWHWPAIEPGTGYLGASPGQRSFLGLVDDMQLWNRALSAQEIMDLSRSP